MSKIVPESCDYLVVGAGATGMAFCDTLLLHSNASVTVILIDSHPAPGGQWNVSYDFVELHQPSALYGVESSKLEPPLQQQQQQQQQDSEGQHRATRREILDYYSTIQAKWEATGRLCFVGEATFDFASNKQQQQQQQQQSNVYDTMKLYSFLQNGVEIMVQVRKKLVDARFLQPDLPIDTPPKFQYSSAIHCVPVNGLSQEAALSISKGERYYVIIGSGKTGMDAVLYLHQKGIDLSKLLWIMPSDAWITAREKIGNCMEFLHDAVLTLTTTTNNKTGTRPENWIQETFLEWERQGKVYRLNSQILPSKFRDATLSKQEVSILQKVTAIRGSRLTEIRDNGDMVLVDGRVVSLPWGEDNVPNTTFVHCSAGAFHYTKQQCKNHSCIFEKDGRITINDVYGTPGFCFNGAFIGFLEALGNKFTDDDKNNLTILGPSGEGPTVVVSPLGPSGGDVDVGLIKGYVQRLSNLKKWLQVPEIRDWLVGNRLFNLGGLSASEISTMVNETWQHCQDLRSG